MYASYPHPSSHTLIAHKVDENGHDRIEKLPILPYPINTINVIIKICC